MKNTNTENNKNESTKSIKLGNTTFLVTSFFDTQNTFEDIVETYATNKILQEIKKI